MTDNTHEPMTEDEIHYCAVHPERDTELRCNRCNRYMCIKCAVRTPVGYTCKECVRGHEDKFFQGTELDYLIVGVIAFFGGAIGAGIIGLVGGFIYLTFILSPIIGGTVGQLALSLTGRRRGRLTGYVCAGSLIAGGILVALFFKGFLVMMLLYIALAGSAAFASIKIQI